MERLLRLHGQLSLIFPSVEIVSEKAKGSADHLRENIQRATEAVDNFDSDAGIEILSDLASYDFGGEVNRQLKDALTALKRYDYDGAKKQLLDLPVSQS